MRFPPDHEAHAIVFDLDGTLKNKEGNEDCLQDCLRIAYCRKGKIGDPPNVQDGGGGRTRTYEAMRRLIYTPLLPWSARYVVGWRACLARLSAAAVSCTGILYSLPPNMQQNHAGCRYPFTP
jgi:hypothetical protein